MTIDDYIRVVVGYEGYYTYYKYEWQKERKICRAIKMLMNISAPGAVTTAGALRTMFLQTVQEIKSNIVVINR